MDGRKTIWKYPLGKQPNKVVEERVVAGFRPLCVRIQGQGFYMWGTCSRDVDCHKWIRVAIVGTGRDMPDPILRWNYLGTVETPGAEEIYHIFIDTYEKLEGE